MEREVATGSYTLKHEHERTSTAYYKMKLALFRMARLDQSVTQSFENANVSVKVKIKAKVTLRLAVSLQSVRLDVKPFETDETFFSTEPLR
jgi:hypothetical protein